MRATISWTEETEDGEEIVHDLPAKNEVCDRCDGHGTHLNPNIGEHAYTREEFDEAFDDDESRAQYFKRGGIYDVTCEVCGGKNVVLVVDEDACDKAVLARYLAHEEQVARWDAEDRATRRMESGGYDY